ncbi:MAG: hypothetical protein VKL39_13120 [Leptolyngbyaceae bacterium]|nr:hypothetical protein [Leptolyngbyaceae bacterium]
MGIKAIRTSPTTLRTFSCLVLLPVFLAIAYRVFSRSEASESVSQSHRQGRR